jgi:hypothetical protein
LVKLAKALIEAWLIKTHRDAPRLLPTLAINSSSDAEIRDPVRRSWSNFESDIN